MNHLPKHVVAALVLAFAFVGNGAQAPVQPGLTLRVEASAPTQHLVAFYDGYDRGGNTSIAFDADNSYKWSGPSPYRADSWGYFTAEGREVPYVKRDRDLGQTFTYTDTVPKTLTAITVSTGHGTNVVRPGTYGQPVSLQLFEVRGNATLHDNGSGPGSEAFHGFPHNRATDSIPPQRDDYLAGETYVSLGVLSGAVFPEKTAFGFADATAPVPPDHPALKGRFLTFTVPRRSRLVLQPGRTYAFLVMLDRMSANCGFTLANHYAGHYAGGHTIRRDGNGVFPPPPAHPHRDFTDPANAQALAAAHFPADFTQRCRIPPGTNGYPDVDTWRDVQFYVQAN